ncbi:MAG: SDR family NAD(P)-dependent oxidoreductase [Agriterribacter sp.]
MKTTGNTVLITGGSAGIGFETARLLGEKGNRVIITGRDAVRLEHAAAHLKNVTTIQSDVSDERQVVELVKKLQQDFPELNVVINNAGRAILHNISEAEDGFSKAQEEMLTNYLSIIRLNEKLLPLLKAQQNAAIVNVSSIVAFVPNRVLSTYGASKAALHSYTQSLRLSLQQTAVKVFELMPPLVNTEFSQEIGGSKGIPPSEVAQQLLDGLENNNYEIHVGRTAELYKLFLSSPQEALLAMNS